MPSPIVVSDIHTGRTPIHMKYNKFIYRDLLFKSELFVGSLLPASSICEDTAMSTLLRVEREAPGMWTFSTLLEHCGEQGALEQGVSFLALWDQLSASCPWNRAFGS